MFKLMDMKIHVFTILLQSFAHLDLLHISESLSLVCVDYNEHSYGECLLISSLPGKALRTLVDIARFAERFNMHSQS